MPSPPRLRSAPSLDLVCLASFVLIGGRQHQIGEGVTWFLRVMWPLCVGIFGVALLVHLYTRATHIWRALALTVVGGVVVMQVLRGAFLGHPWVSAFPVVAAIYLALTMFGWRLVAALVVRSSARRCPRGARAR